MTEISIHKIKKMEELRSLLSQKSKQSKAKSISRPKYYRSSNNMEINANLVSNVEVVDSYYILLDCKSHVHY